MTAKSQSTLLMVDNRTGVAKMVDAIEKEKGRAIVPGWPWDSAGGAAEGAAAEVDQTLRLIAGGLGRPGYPPGRAPAGTGAPARRSSCPIAVAARRRR